MAPATTNAKNTDIAARIDSGMPSEDNASPQDMAMLSDAISDKLEYAVHRSGWTPRLKMLMAALRHARDIGGVAFQHVKSQKLDQDHEPKRALMRYLSKALDAPLKVFTPQAPNADYSLPSPMMPPRPKFVRG